MTQVNAQGQIKSMLISEKLPRNKLYVDLIEPYTRREDRPEFNILLKPFLLNSLAQKVYIMHNILAMMIVNIVDILCTTEYYHS